MGHAAGLAGWLPPQQGRHHHDRPRTLAGSQRALIGKPDRKRGGALMAAVEACTGRWGRGTVVPATSGFAPARSWSMKFNIRSPRYTTRVEELPVVQVA